MPAISTGPIVCAYLRLVMDPLPIDYLFLYD